MNQDLAASLYGDDAGAIIAIASCVTAIKKSHQPAVQDEAIDSFLYSLQRSGLRGAEIKKRFDKYPTPEAFMASLGFDQ